MNNPSQLLQNLQQLKANPMQAIMARRLNVPQEILNDPNAITKHLLSTGQITQEQVNQAYQTAQKLGFR